MNEKKIKLLMSFYIIVFNVKLHFSQNATNATFLIKRQISMKLFKIKLLKHNKL